MTPDQEFRAGNRLWQLQQLQWAFESCVVDELFRMKMHKITDAADVIREYAVEFRGEPVRNIVQDVIHKPPREWKKVWCNPDNIERWEKLK